MAILLYSILPVSFLSFFCKKCPDFYLQKFGFNDYLPNYHPLDFIDILDASSKVVLLKMVFTFSKLDFHLSQKRAVEYAICIPADIPSYSKDSLDCAISLFADDAIQSAIGVLTLYFQTNIWSIYLLFLAVP